MSAEDSRDAGEQDADRNVGQQMCAHRVAQAGAQLLDELRLVVPAQLVNGHGTRAGVAAELDPAALRPDQQVARRKLPRVAEDRIGRRNRVERKKGLERIDIDLAAWKRAELRRELERVAGVAVVERLDPVAVAREHETPGLGIPDRDREHPAESPHVLRAVAPVEVEMDFGIAVGPEDVALALELSPQLGIVVDLAVLHDDT